MQFPQCRPTKLAVSPVRELPATDHRFLSYLRSKLIQLSTGHLSGLGVVDLTHAPATDLALTAKLKCALRRIVTSAIATCQGTTHELSDAEAKEELKASAVPMAVSLSFSVFFSVLLFLCRLTPPCGCCCLLPHLMLLTAPHSDSPPFCSLFLACHVSSHHISLFLSFCAPHSLHQTGNRPCVLAADVVSCHFF